jgi:hypothetical protein
VDDCKPRDRPLPAELTSANRISGRAMDAGNGTLHTSTAAV